MFDNPVDFILRIPAILIALTIHEVAHGWIALKCGDTTARDDGRLTLNPISHLDPFGAIMLMFGPFGWAKPVPVNGYRLNNPKRDIVLISLAGPVSNIILALIFGISLQFLGNANPLLLNYYHLGDFLQKCIEINIGISFFNLLPIPPLDGSKILMGMLPDKWIPGYLEKSKHVPMIFLGLIVVEWAFKIPVISIILYPLYLPYYHLWYSVIGLVG